MIFRHMVDGKAKAFDALAQRGDAVFLAAGDDDQAAEFHPCERLGDVGLVLALVFGAEDQRAVIVRSLDLRRRLYAACLQLAIERAKTLHRGQARLELGRQREAGLGAEKQDAFTFTGCSHGGGSKGMEQGLQGVAAHGLSRVKGG